METKTFLETCSSYLLLAISRFNNQGEKVTTPISGYTAKRVEIDGHIFETIAVIIHVGSGLTNDSSHYYCQLKQPNGQWLVCNDTTITIKQQFIRELKDAYILLLRKCS